MLYLNNIEKILEEKNMSISQLATATNGTYQAIRRIVKTKDLKNKEIGMLNNIANVLNVEIEDLYTCVEDDV